MYKAMLLLRLAALFGFALTGCNVAKINSSAPTSPFLAITGADPSGRMARLPFDHSWRSPQAEAGKYKNIVVRPVSIKWLSKEQWGESVSPLVPDQKSYLKHCAVLASYWTKSLRKAYSSPVCSYYITDDASKPNTVILEVAITEITFGTPPTGFGSMAFEARVKDAATGKYAATVADRRATISKIAHFNQKALTQANQQIIDEWSQQLMEVSNKELFPTVTNSVFTPF